MLSKVYTYVFLCRMAHKANSFPQPVRSSAAISASSVDMARSLRSCEMVCLQVVRGLPCPESAMQFMAYFGSLSVFMRIRWPYQVRRLFWGALACHLSQGGRMYFVLPPYFEDAPKIYGVITGRLWLQKSLARLFFHCFGYSPCFGPI